MKTFFIEQSRRTNKLIGICQGFKKVTKNENKILIHSNLEKAKFKTKVNLVKNIIKILEKERSRQIVLEKRLKIDKQFVNLLYGYNINICDQKWLFKRITNDIITKFLKDKKKEESEIWICANEIDLWLEKFIEQSAKEFKNINIITNHIGRFKKIEEKLYNNYGILINLSNNKRKSLLKANLILNVDFPKELLNQFAIFEEAIIINLEGDISIRKRRFKGNVINDYKIGIDKDNEIYKFILEKHLENYDLRDICQAIGKIPKNMENNLILN